MYIADVMHIRHAAVAKFHRVFVEDLSQDVRWWEIFVDNFQEFPADVGRNIAAVWRVEPDDVSISRALFLSSCGLKFSLTL